MVSHHAKVLVHETDVPDCETPGTERVVETETAVVIREDQDVVSIHLTEVSDR